MTAEQNQNVYTRARLDEGGLSKRARKADYQAHPAGELVCRPFGLCEPCPVDEVSSLGSCLLSPLLAIPFFKVLVLGTCLDTLIPGYDITSYLTTLPSKGISKAQSTSLDPSTRLVCHDMNRANPQRTQPFCQPFGNRRLLHCKSSKESDGRSTEVPAWEACGKVVKQERQDFWEFVVSPSLQPARASSSLTTLTWEISPSGRHPPQPPCSSLIPRCGG